MLAFLVKHSVYFLRISEKKKIKSNLVLVLESKVSILGLRTYKSNERRKTKKTLTKLQFYLVLIIRELCLGFREQASDVFVKFHFLFDVL